MHFRIEWKKRIPIATTPTFNREGAAGRIPPQVVWILGLTWFVAGSALAQDLVPLNVKLPAAAFIGTPSDDRCLRDVETPSKTPPPPFLAPAGVTNVAFHKKVTSSATNATPEGSGQNHRW